MAAIGAMKDTNGTGEPDFWRSVFHPNTFADSMGNSTDPLHLLEQDIAERLAPVCEHMSPESFRALVHDIALVKIKYGVQSLSAEERDGPIGEVVVMARVVNAEEENRNSAA